MQFEFFLVTEFLPRYIIISIIISIIIWYHIDIKIYKKKY